MSTALTTLVMENFPLFSPRTLESPCTGTKRSPDDPLVGGGGEGGPAGSIWRGSPRREMLPTLGMCLLPSPAVSKGLSGFV